MSLKHQQTDLFLYPLFVYGSLSPGQRFYKEVSNYQSEQAWVYNMALYMGPKYPYASDGTGVVYGQLIYNVDVKKLNRLDGLRSHLSSVNRELRYVHTANKQNIPAWIYIYPDANHYPIIPSGRFY